MSTTESSTQDTHDSSSTSESSIPHIESKTESEHKEKQPSKESVEIKHSRRIIAEDPEWNLARVDSLRDLCIPLIVKNFEKKPLNLPAAYRERIINAISIDLPLSIASLIPDESYWKKRSKARFPLAQTKNHGGSWKRLFFELHISTSIEGYRPNDDTTQLMEDVRVAAPWIRRLFIRQLHSINAPFQPEFQSQVQVSLKPCYDTLDHIDLYTTLSPLSSLEHLSIYFGLTDVGVQFAWAYFGMTLQDCIQLTKFLAQSAIKHLVIQSSCIEDDKCRLLAHSLLTTQIQYLDLSHNKIEDAGARGLAKLIEKNPLLTQLYIGHNKIGFEGADALANVLSTNQTLKVLDLTGNVLADAGADTLLRGVGSNTCLESLDISGNGFGKTVIDTLVQTLKKNSTLVTLNLSSNKIGNTPPAVDATEFTSHMDSDVAGKAIFSSINQNKTIKELDLRMTDISSDYMVAIQNILNEN